ncbi:hypothetical protein ACFPRL_18065 [Pseudoclavibacter helvolus]
MSILTNSSRGDLDDHRRPSDGSPRAKQTRQARAHHGGGWRALR